MCACVSSDVWSVGWSHVWVDAGLLRSFRVGFLLYIDQTCVIGLCSRLERMLEYDADDGRER